MHPLDTLIKNEFDEIAKTGQGVVKYAIDLKIRTPEKILKALFVTDYSLLRDYINRFSDVLSITGVFGAGSAIVDIAKFPNQLQATVSLFPMTNSPDPELNGNTGPRIFTYKALLYDDAMELIASNLDVNGKVDKANLNGLKGITFQLINPMQEALRSKSFGGCIRNANPAMAIQGLLQKYSKSVSTETSMEIKGVDLVPGYNPEIRDHIIVPHLTPFISLPEVINKLVGGIYPTGFSYYLQDNYWYIFSPYNTKLYDQRPYTLTVINVTKDKLPSLERTFRKTPTQLIVISTGQVSYQRISDKAAANETLGTRFVDASKILGGIGKVGGNKLSINRKENINEFQLAQGISDTNTDIPEGMGSVSSNMAFSRVTESARRITTKYYEEYSRIAMNSGAFLQFTWENSNDDLIVPGMPLRFIYMDGTMPKQCYGTVMAIESTFTSVSHGAQNKIFGNSTVVSCFVDDSILNSKMQ